MSDRENREDFENPIYAAEREESRNAKEQMTEQDRAQSDNEGIYW